jgi:hypothetical protein
VLAVATTVAIVLLEIFWLFWVFVIGNLVSLALSQRNTSILRFDPIHPLATAGVLEWDRVSTIYMLIALGMLVVARRYYRREYGSEFLAFVVAAPALLAGGLAALGVVIRLVVFGLAVLFDGSTELDTTFWTWLLIAVTGGAYLGLCVLALRAAVFVGNVWLGDVHNPNRNVLIGNRPITEQAEAYLKAFYRMAKSNPSYKLVRLNWRTRGWQVSQVTTSDDRSSRTSRLFVTTSGRAVYVGNTGVVEKLRPGYLEQFPVNWSTPPRRR